MKPREKLKVRGVDGLSDIELIAVILGSGIKGVDYFKLATKVYTKLKDLDSKRVNFNALQSILGLGEVKAMQISCAVELGLRLHRLSGKSKEVVRNSKEAYLLLRPLLSLKREYVKGIFLNARYELLAIKIISIGTFNRSFINSRDIATYALELNAAYVILGHNHPSGDTNASIQDIETTRIIRKALAILDIKLIDHIIVSENGWTSVPI